MTIQESLPTHKYCQPINELTIPIEIRDVSDGLGVLITGRGLITEKEDVDVFTKHLTQDSRKLKKYRYCFADWTAVSKAEISTKAINLIASLNISAERVNPDVILASVADQDSMYGLSRMTQTLRDRFPRLKPGSLLLQLQEELTKYFHVVYPCDNIWKGSFIHG